MVKIIVKIFILATFIRFAEAQDTIDFMQHDASPNGKNWIAVYGIDSTIGKPKADPDNFDVRLFRSINRSRTSFKDKVLPITDRSGPPMGFVLPISAFVYGRASKHYYDENTGFLLGLTEGLNLFTTFGLKFAVNRKRPYAALGNVYYQQVDKTDPYSFPSGHTSITFAIAVLYNLRYPKYPQVYVPMYLYSIVVAYGRPYFGMHYPSDLLGGAMVGAGSAVLIYSLRNHLLKFKNNILSENKEDTGTINGNNALIFGSAFVVSGLIGEFVLHTNKVNISFSPYYPNHSLLNLNLMLSF